MKSNDNNSLFEVFKPGVRDDLTFGKKLWYWFTNVYWYHFRTITLLALFGIIMLCVFIGDIINRPNDDVGIIVAGDTYVSLEQERGILDYLKTAVEDVNGDGKITIGHQTLCTSAVDSDLEGDDLEIAEQYDAFVDTSKNKLYVSFADDQFLLYILDEGYMEAYAGDGAMEPLSSFGIESENGYYLYVGQTELFKSLGIVEDPNNKWCIGIKVKGDTRTKEKFLPKYEQAANALRAIVGQE